MREKDDSARMHKEFTHTHLDKLTNDVCSLKRLEHTDKSRRSEEFRPKKRR
jgi:hypothetical protein